MDKCEFCNQPPVGKTVEGTRVCEEHFDDSTCSRCRLVKNSVDRQYSFGVYAGRFCTECAIAGFRDHCGLTGHMGTESEWNELGDVPYREDD